MGLRTAGSGPGGSGRWRGAGFAVLAAGNLFAKVMLGTWATTMGTGPGTRGRSVPHVIVLLVAVARTYTLASPPPRPGKGKGRVETNCNSFFRPNLPRSQPARWVGKSRGIARVGGTPRGGRPNAFAADNRRLGPCLVKRRQDFPHYWGISLFEGWCGHGFWGRSEP